MNEKKEFCYSTDGENFHTLGEFATAREAAEAFFKDNAADETVEIAEPSPPSEPEDFIDADLIIEHVGCQDDYQCDAAEDWPGATVAQLDELTEELRKVFASWLHKHGLRPGFYTCRDAQKFSRFDFGLPLVPESVAPVEKTLTTDRSDPGLREIRPDGQQEKYLVLSEEERAKGFVRPLRRAYRHLRCDGVTTMGLALCETYARNPKFYGGTFCCVCGSHFPLKDAETGARNFVWVEDETGVGE